MSISRSPGNRLSCFLRRERVTTGADAVQTGARRPQAQSHDSFRQSGPRFSLRLERIRHLQIDRYRGVENLRSQPDRRRSSSVKSPSVASIEKPFSGFPSEVVQRAQIGWVFDGRMREPTRQLSFFQGGYSSAFFAPIDLSPAVDALRDALGGGAVAVNEDEGVRSLLAEVAGDPANLGLIDALVQA